MHSVLDVVVVYNSVDLPLLQLFEGPRPLTLLLSFHFAIVGALVAILLVALEEVPDSVDREAGDFSNLLVGVNSWAYQANGTKAKDCHLSLNGKCDSAAPFGIYILDELHDGTLW